MAYTTANVKRVGSGGGRNNFTYDTTDSQATVAGASYFSDGVSVHGFNIGDRLTIRTWASAIPAMTTAAKNAATLTTLYEGYVSSISTNAATIKELDHTDAT